MKRIKEYKNLFAVEGEIDLKQLKTTYRGLVKQWHPDKFAADVDRALEAEAKSKQIIDGYHFLVSIAPETKAANLAEYNNTLNTAAIQDFQHKSMLLEVTFTNGFTYEYFGVDKKMFSKLINADRQMRFAKRSIFNSFLYRKVKTAAVAV